MDHCVQTVDRRMKNGVAGWNTKRIGEAGVVYLDAVSSASCFSEFVFLEADLEREVAFCNATRHNTRYLVDAFVVISITYIQVYSDHDLIARIILLQSPVCK